MQARTQEQIRGLLENELEITGTTAAEGKAKAFYKAYMDEDRLESLGTGPLQHDLRRLRAISSKSAMTRFMGKQSFLFGSSLIDTEVIPDSSDTTQHMLELRESGLGLPGREYYLEPRFAVVKQNYTSYIATLLRLAGWPKANQQAAQIVAFETTVAEVSWSDGQERDATKTYNPVKLAEVEAAFPGLDVHAFLKAAGYTGELRMSLREPSALSRIAQLYSAESLDTLKAWEAFHIVDQSSTLLPHRFRDANFEFREHILQGRATPSPRWRGAVEAENEWLGEAVGQMYVARYFTPQAKAQMEQLVANLKATFHDRLERAAWMSPATKASALKKLESMSVGVGYPSVWKSYDFSVTETDLFGDVERSLDWTHTQDVERLNKPVDREAWDLVPQSLASEYNSSLNRMTFPAANLQFPFFDPKADPAINYGAIGVVIGHEMTHGFDDQGRHTDSAGLLRDWWVATDAKKFEAQADNLSRQYSGFEALPGVHVNGSLTLGEDLADTGGMAIALDAYHRSLDGAAAPVLDGTTGDQRFFLGAAQVWAGKTRSEAVRRQLTNNNHPPGEQRVNGEVRNLDDWYAAFHVTPGDKLYIAPEDRVHIW